MRRRLNNDDPHRLPRTGGILPPRNSVLLPQRLLSVDPRVGVCHAAHRQPELDFDLRGAVPRVARDGAMDFGSIVAENVVEVF